MSKRDWIPAVLAAASLAFASACTVEEDDDGVGDETSGQTQGDSADSANSGDSADSGDSGDSGGGLSSECTQLCDNTPTALDLEAQCVPAVLSDVGGYTFLEPSCVALSDAYDAGVATATQCVACYRDAGVAASHCTIAESMCFL